MYNQKVINQLISFIQARNGKAKKDVLKKEVQTAFSLDLDRSIYYCKDFAIRFCECNKPSSFSNTVVALSKVKKYDDRPFLICIVRKDRNDLLLANSTFIMKISHSSSGLKHNKIVGNINGCNIVKIFEGTDNEPANFEVLYAIHENYGFEGNLERLVAETNNIQPKGKRFEPDAQQTACILASVERAQAFLRSDDHAELQADLQRRVGEVSAEIMIAAGIDNVNVRGRVIEFLITSEKEQRAELVSALHSGSKLPEIYTADGLGDFCRSLQNFETATDIKTKMLSLSSAPKGYNIDKVLEFLATEKSVYLVFLVGIDEENDRVSTRLCSMYHRQLLEGIRILGHWAGRNSRGVTQYDGASLESIIAAFDDSIDTAEAERFIRICLEHNA